MSNILGSLKPSNLWKNFDLICSVPHPSGKEEKIRQAILEFAKNLKLETYVDEIGNVIIRKPATKGMENRKGIIFQAHIDMVPQKNSDTAHDFEKDPIKPRIDGEWVKATGTTLGADNGIGVAAAMAVLESTDIPHGPIECLFTIDEEAGMTGAFGLKGGYIHGDILLNLDSEDEGELYIGCAGGVNTGMEFTFKNDAIPANSSAFKVSITGLKGGHSGMDIILGRGNSNKVMFRMLWNASKNYQLRIASVEGGSLRNAIPREAFAVVTVPNQHADAFKKYIAEYYATVKQELIATEPDIKIGVENTNLPANVIDQHSQNNIIASIYSCPNGVIRMCDDMPGLVETSTNLAIVKTEGDKLSILCLLRSSVNSAKQDLQDTIEALFVMAGAKVIHDGAYPGWKPNTKSEILNLMKDIYNKKYGKTPDVKAIHAGLECGLLGEIYPNWDMISFGPTIRNPHSPDERVNIASVEKFWDYLVETLKNVPVK